MKKIFALLTVLFMLTISATALASQKMYHHPDYDFSVIKTIKVTEIEYELSESSGNYHADAKAESKVLSSLYSASTKQNLVILDERNKEKTADEGSLLNQNKKAPKTVELRLTINHMGYKKVVTPGHYIDKTEYIQTKSYDKRGREQTISIPVTRSEWIPETVQYASYLNIEYNVYDLETGDLIANLNDERSRQYESDTSGMLSRSTKEFLNQLTKKK